MEHDGQGVTGRKPEWLQKRVNPAAHREMERLLSDLSLNTVCHEAHCPNITECFCERQATFLIMGAACTRFCTFCSVSKVAPLPVDLEEPERVAEAAVRLALSHVVITSPTRDDLPDGGAVFFSATIRAIREALPAAAVEVLVPDFRSRRESIAMVVDAGPDIFGHNVETVPRLYGIREGAEYRRSLEVLHTAAQLSPSLRVKSGIMVGLGETEEEVLQVMRDLRGAGCSCLSIGQYLPPSRSHEPVKEYVAPERFERYRVLGLELGFNHVESGPYVRSSYHAGGYLGAPGGAVTEGG